MFYFMFLLAFPLNIPYTPVLFLIAATCSIFEKGKMASGKSSNLVARIFTDEEPMNLALLLLFLFSTTFVKFFLYLCLLMFSFLMWSEWAFEMLEESRKPGGKQVYGLPALQPVIDFLLLFRVEITQLKSHIEVFLGFLSVVLLFTGRIAPIFPIFFWQYLRIKYVVSSFTQLSFKGFD